MVEPIIALSIFDRLLAILGLIRENDKLAEQRKDEALAALYAALKGTKSYLNARAARAERDLGREMDIAGLWQAASIPLRHIDPHFASVAFEKGGYWMQPEIWTDEQIEAKGIKIDQVMRETRELLRKE